MSNFNKPTKETVMQQLDKLEADVADLKAKTQQEFYDELRNNIIEEVAARVERLAGFGRDTMDSFALYIREMKTDNTFLVKYEHRSYGYWKDKDGNLVLGTIPHTKTDPSPELLDAASKE